MTYSVPTIHSVPAGRQGSASSTLLEAAVPTMLDALKRALFVLESPTMPAFVNAAGAVDAVRAAIAQVEGTA